MATAPAPRLPASDSQPDVFARQLKGRKKGRFWRSVGILCLFAMGVGTGLAVFTKPGRGFIHIIPNLPGMIQARGNPHLIFEKVHAGNPVDANRVNILIIGQDRNWKQGKVLDPTTGKFRPYQVIDTDTRPRSDSMIVMSLDDTNKTVRLISFPRDSRITYTDFDGVRHRRRKLNSVYAEPRGDELLKKVFADELGIRIDRTAILKLDGFNKLIDDVKGVEVNVEGALMLNRRTHKEYRGPMKYEDKWGGWKIDLEPGLQTLNGEQAHGYVRFRIDREGDPGRVRRQQQVMRALAKKLMTMGTTEVLSVMDDAEQVLSTDMPADELVSAGMFAKKLDSSDKITPLTPYGIYATNGDIILNRPENIKLLSAIFGASFNPENFLQHSPSTTADDIGKRNNDNPAALPVLREAGLVDAADTKPSEDAEKYAPGLQQ